MSSLRPAIFLDRDGTLNEPILRNGLPFSPSKPEAFKLLPGVPEGCHALHSAGYVLVVTTNQPEIGRGTLSSTTVATMHAKLIDWVPTISRIEICPASGRGIQHDENRRRKPEPGMLLDAASDIGLDLTRSWMIGDRWRDIECGHNAGVKTVFIDHGYRESLRRPATFTVPDFPSAVATILAAGTP